MAADFLHVPAGVRLFLYRGLASVVHPQRNADRDAAVARLRDDSRRYVRQRDQSVLRYPVSEFRIDYLDAARPLAGPRRPPLPGDRVAPLTNAFTGLILLKPADRRSIATKLRLPRLSEPGQRFPASGEA